MFTNRGRINSVGRALDCRAEGRGFNSRGRTYTQGLKITENSVPNEYVCAKYLDTQIGALLCEMCIRQLPDPQRRNEQVVLVTNSVSRGLVRRCIQREPRARPTMLEIIDELKEFDPIS